MTIDEKIDRLIDLTARSESGGRYDAWVENDNGHGPSFGLIQNNSTRGSLGKLIVMMREAKPAWWMILFGASVEDADPAFWGREIASHPDAYRDALQLSGQVPIWQKCQRDLARQEYFEPAAKLCARFGLVSERAHAMALDVAVQYGVGGLSEKLYTCRNEPTERYKLAHLALLADTHAYDTNRRHTMLQSRELSDEPMFPKPVSETPTDARPTLRLGDVGGSVASLRAALRMPHSLPEPVGDYAESFTFAVEQAVKAFQAAHGLTVDGIVGPATWKALDEAARKGEGGA